MLIRFLSGPKKGQTDHAPQGQETELLLKAGIIERVVAPVPPAVVSWGVNTGQVTQRVFIVASCSRENCTRTRFEGPVNLAAGVKHQHACGGGPPVPVPAEIVKTYAKAKNEEVPVIDRTEAAMFRESTRHGWPKDNKGREIKMKPDWI
jgi:hypothetical protein